MVLCYPRTNNRRQGKKRRTEQQKMYSKIDKFPVYGIEPQRLASG